MAVCTARKFIIYLPWPKTFEMNYGSYLTADAWSIYLPPSFLTLCFATGILVAACVVRAWFARGENKNKNNSMVRVEFLGHCVV